MVDQYSRHRNHLLVTDSAGCRAIVCNTHGSRGNSSALLEALRQEIFMALVLTPLGARSACWRYDLLESSIQVINYLNMAID